MNILHLHTGLNLTCGISKTIFSITKYPQEKNRHFVIALGGDAENKFAESGIQVKLLNLKKESLGKVVKSVKDFIRENDIQILHSHHRYFDLISYLISFSCRVKRVTSVQSFVYGKKIFSYKSTLLLAAGDSVKKHLTGYFGINEKKIKVFNNFIDAGEIPDYDNSENLKIELNIPRNAYLLGYIGRFSVKEKGIDILINAFKTFSKNHSDACLLMVGSGDDIKKLKEIPENMIILNSQKNIFDYYRMLDCLVLPSRVDPFPLTVLEAGMMKIPFIGSDVNGIHEIIENGKDGLLFGKDKEGMLLQNLERYYTDRDFAKLCAENLYKKVMGKYNVISALKTLNKIYEEL